MADLNAILKLIDVKPSEALPLLNAEISKHSSKELLVLRAQTFQKLGQLTNAINDYIEILKIYGADENILQQKLYVESIVKMTQLDVYACTNLHNDPWD